MQDVLLVFLMYSGYYPGLTAPTSQGSESGVAVEQFSSLKDNLMQTALGASLLGTTNNGTNGFALLLPSALTVETVSLLRAWPQHNQRPEQNEPEKCNQQKISTFPPPHSRSSLNLVSLGGKNYLFSNQKMSWVDSMLFCRAYGMDLVSIENKEEDDLIIAHIKNIGMQGGEFFVSAHKIGRTSFLWASGAPLTYTNWGPRQPDSPSVHHCVTLHQGTWYDEPCMAEGAADHQDHFVCEEL